MYLDLLGSRGGGGFIIGGVLRSNGKVTPCCIAHQPPYCLSQSLWQILYCPALLVMMMLLTCWTCQKLKASLMEFLQICLMLRKMLMIMKML